MSGKPCFDKHAEPVADPVNEFMRQLSESAAKHRRGEPPMPKRAWANEEVGIAIDAGPADEPEPQLDPIIDEVAVAEHARWRGCWTVTARSSAGTVFEAIFQGADAEERAREYALWKYGGDA